MNCEDVRDEILRGRIPDDPGLERHLEECEACALLLSGDELVTLFAAPDSGTDLLAPPALGGRLDRIRSAATPVRIIAVALTVLLVGGLNAVLLLRPDAEVYPWARMAVSLAAFAGLAVFLVALSLRPVHLPRPDRRLLPAFVAGSLLLSVLLALLPVAHGHLATHPESFEGEGADFWPRAIACLIYGIVFALPTLLLLRLFVRGGEARGAMLVGGLIASAMAGAVALQLHCPLVSSAHLLVGHAGVPIVLLLIALPLALRRRRAG